MKEYALLYEQKANNPKAGVDHNHMALTVPSQPLGLSSPQPNYPVGQASVKRWEAPHASMDLIN